MLLLFYMCNDYSIYVCMSWTCTLSTSPSLGDLHSFCMTGRAVVCLDGAFGTALADNWRQYLSCTIEFGEKICPYCTIKYVCDSYLHHMTWVLAANRLGSSSGLHRTDICSHGAYWIHSWVCLELINLTMSWSASTTGSTLFGPLPIHVGQALRIPRHFWAFICPICIKLRWYFLHSFFGQGSGSQIYFKSDFSRTGKLVWCRVAGLEKKNKNLILSGHWLSVNLPHVPWEPVRSWPTNKMIVCVSCVLCCGHYAVSNI